MYGGNRRRAPSISTFLSNYTSEELRIASEFLSTWMPFLSDGLCPSCSSTLSRRINSLRSDVDDDSYSSENKPSSDSRTSDHTEWQEKKWNHEHCDLSSFGGWVRGNMNDTTDRKYLEIGKQATDINNTSKTDSLSSWTEGANNLSVHITEASTRRVRQSTGASERISWADLAQEEQELEGDEESEGSGNSSDVNARSIHDSAVLTSRQNPILPREQREFIRFGKVKRKKDFVCFESVKGKLVNILEGLELHTGIFSAVEQERIVDYIYKIQEMGKKGELKARTFTAPAKWMPGKGRVTIQFGCCYNYAHDKKGNPPGILKSETVDPIPGLLKVMIRRLVRWHVLPPSCVPDSCIVNIYDEGDCIPPHIDNHDFVRPFCTVSFLSECNILFGSNLSVVAPGKFSGPVTIPLPVGSVLVLNGNGADVAKHCIPAVPTKRISITFRRMDESKRPHDFVPEPDLQGLIPLSYETENSKLVAQQRPILPEFDSPKVVQPSSNETDRSGRGVLPRPRYSPAGQQSRSENYRGKQRGAFGRGNSYSEPRTSDVRSRLQFPDRRRTRVALDN